LSFDFKHAWNGMEALEIFTEKNIKSNALGDKIDIIIMDC